MWWMARMWSFSIQLNRAPGAGEHRRPTRLPSTAPWSATGGCLFFRTKGEILDRETGSTWSPGGLAVGGQLRGSQLKPLPYTISFWFSWVAFYPDTDLRLNE